MDKPTEYLPEAGEHDERLTATVQPGLFQANTTPTRLYTPTIRNRSRPPKWVKFQPPEPRASADSLEQAAQLAGLTYDYMGQLVRDARREFMALWHEGETPRAHHRKQRMRRRQVDHQPCGTAAGYRRHVYRKEQACAQCRAAIAAYQAKLRAARRAARGRQGVPR